mgnify:CR=1 FL=1
MGVLQEAVTFLILLLYNPEFKFSFGAALLPFYASMAAHPKQHPIAKAMDRLTVQIFNSEVQQPSFASWFENFGGLEAACCLYGISQHPLV